MQKNLITYGALILGLSLFFAACEKPGAPSIMTTKPEFGPAKTLITVEGMNFVDLQSINFNDDVPADFNPSFGTDAALLFRVPENAPLGDNNIVILSEHGETSFPFRVTLEAPEVSFFEPKSANEGETVYILGENFFEPLEVLFFDSVPGNIIYHQPDSLVVEVPPGVEKGRIKVKANGGSSLTGELFFSTTDILVNDFDGNGIRSETDKWLFTGFVDQNSSSAIYGSDPDALDGNFMKLTGSDPGTIWIGGSESNFLDVDVFENFGISSDINNTFLDVDLNSNGSDKTHLIIGFTERDGSFNDFSVIERIDGNGWNHLSIPLNRFTDVDGATVDPAKIKSIKLHLYNELEVSQKLEVNVDNLKFVQIN